MEGDYDLLVIHRLKQAVRFAIFVGAFHDLVVRLHGADDTMTETALPMAHTHHYVAV